VAVTASIKLSSEAAELARLEAFADAFARGRGLPDDERVRLLLILEELFTNVVVHGYAPGAANGSISVVLGWGAGRLTIDLVDDGRPFDPLAREAPDLDVPGEEREIGGLGIHIVRSLVDEASYRRSGSQNHLQLARQVEPPAA
jgi:anti-sigma regulatory factor (Ser/Thr protein kinase)